MPHSLVIVTIKIKTEIMKNIKCICNLRVVIHEDEKNTPPCMTHPTSHGPFPSHPECVNLLLFLYIN